MIARSSEQLANLSCRKYELMYVYPGSGQINSPSREEPGYSKLEFEICIAIIETIKRIRSIEVKKVIEKFLIEKQNMNLLSISF